jgi:hypothetical protein
MWESFWSAGKSSNVSLNLFHKSFFLGVEFVISFNRRKCQGRGRTRLRLSWLKFLALFLAFAEIHHERNHTRSFGHLIRFSLTYASEIMWSDNSIIKSTVSWEITPCSPLSQLMFLKNIPPPSSGYKSRKIPAWKQVASRVLLATCFHAGILLGLFDPEDGGGMFNRLRSVISQRQNSS